MKDESCRQGCVRACSVVVEASLAAWAMHGKRAWHDSDERNVSCRGGHDLLGVCVPQTLSRCAA